MGITAQGLQMVCSKNRKQVAKQKEDEQLERWRLQLGQCSTLADVANVSEQYLKHRYRSQFTRRPDDAIYPVLLGVAQTKSQQVYDELRSGILTRNQVISLMIPLAEYRCRLQRRSNLQRIDDVEGEALWGLCEAVKDAATKPEPIKNFGKFCIAYINAAMIDFIKIERNAERHQPASVAKVDFEKRIDERTSSATAEIDALDFVLGLARDDTDLRILKLAADGHSNLEIASQVDLSESAVSKRLRRMDGRGCEPLAAFAEDSIDDSIVQMKAAGQSDKKIARSLGISPTTVAARVATMERRMGCS